MKKSFSRRDFLKAGAATAALATLAACTPKVSTTTTPTPTATQPPEVVQGPGTGVETQPPSVTVQTPGGQRTFPIGPTTGLTLDGQACTIEDLLALDASGQPYNCTVVTDDLGNIFAINVTRQPQVASVTGTISDVNIQDSTITVQTAEGPKVFDVDPNTGQLIGGVACSLELVNSLAESGAPLECTVIYTVKDGEAVYIDIANPPDLIQGTGTLTEVSPEKSTVTIQTDKGPRTFEVDPNTGMFLGGEVCSLLEAQEAAQSSSALPCEVLYYTDADGNLVYLDISHNP